MRVAQENLYMLKRLNEKTSFYNVNKLNRDYEMSQYYKKNHCLYSPIDFTKSNKFLSGSIIKLTKKKFFNKTHYASTGKLEYIPPITPYIPKSTRRRKKFEDFNYRDLNLDQKQKSDILDSKEKQFKKISEIDTEENKEKEEKENDVVDNNIEKKEEDKNEENNKDNNKEENKEEENKEEKKKEEEKNEEKKNEEEKKEEEKKEEEKNEEENKKEEKEEEDGDGGIKEQTQNRRDEKEENDEKDENNKENN